MRNKRVAILIALLLLHKLLFSQVYFSQFHSSPLNINPANTGRYDGDLRAGGVFRNERDQLALSTKASVFFDTRLLAAVLPENDRLAVGVSAAGERYPYFGVTNNYAQLSLAYHKSLSRDGSQQLGVGFQAGWGNQRLQQKTQVFESTIINSGFSGIYPGAASVNINYPDFSLGVDFQGRLTGQDLVTVGISVYHVTHPHEIVNNSVFSLPREAGGQLGWVRTIDERSTFRAEAVAVLTPETHTLNDVIAGGLYETQIDQSPYRLGAGAFFRRNYLTGTSVVPTLTLLYNSISIQVSYDATVSKKETDQLSAFELGLVYTGRRLSRK